MKRAGQKASNRWTIFQAMTLTGACLISGTAGGWLIRVWQTPAVTGATQAAEPASAGTSGAEATTAQLKTVADNKAAPLLAKLQSDPNNAELLTSLGNLYYDARQYPLAVGYYGRALKVKPSDIAVRTDMGTAYWYMGDADSAIAAFNQALADAPDNPNTLFNLGIVEWQGKMDTPAAVTAWKHLLAANPSYEGKAEVEQLIAQAEKRGAAGPGLN